MGGNELGLGAVFSTEMKSVAWLGLIVCLPGIGQQPTAECKGMGPVRYSVMPMDPADISVYLPLGLMVDAHVTPVDHVYFSPANYNLGRDAYPVRAPADGVITAIQWRGMFVGNQNPAGGTTSEFRVVVEHTCTFLTYFDLITSLEPSIVEAMGGAPTDMRTRAVRIPVTAGQVIGRIGAQTLDMGAVNTEVVLPGFIVPEHYRREPWKIHTVDPLEYFGPELRDRLLPLNPRKAEPRGGKIDYDIDGRFVGNWFLEGTNWYAGSNPSRPWEGHFTAAYHYLDPANITISMGDYGGRSQQFWVRGNGPDPKDVSVESGLVVYELIPVGLHLAGRASMDLVWSRDDSKILGVLLVEMIEDRKVRLEVFPVMKAVEVSGFTDAARIYER
jgi:hypothetical protein